MNAAEAEESGNFFENLFNLYLFTKVFEIKSDFSLTETHLTAR